MSANQTSPAVFVVGHYGFQNVGDEAILASLVSHLRDLVPTLRVTVASGDPESTARDHGVHAVLWSNMMAIWQAIVSTDLVIVGGGGLFHDYWGVSSQSFLTSEQSGLSYFAAPFAIAALCEKPAMVYGVGVGPLNSETGRFFTRFACDVASAITVRDTKSKQILESLGVHPGRIVVTADPAFGESLEVDHDFLQRLDSGSGSGLRITVAPRHWSMGVSPETWEAEFARGLDLFLSDYDGSIRFVACQRNKLAEFDDCEASRRIQACMRHRDRTSVLDESLSPGRLLAILSHSDLVVGLRLHSLILGITAHTPAVAVSYDTKVAETMRAAGMEDLTIELDRLCASELARLMAVAVRERRVAPHALLSSLARQNAHLALDLLRHKPSQNIFPKEVGVVLRQGFEAQTRRIDRLEAECSRLLDECSHYQSLSRTHATETKGVLRQLDEAERQTRLRQAQVTVLVEDKRRLEFENATRSIALEHVMAQRERDKATLTRILTIIGKDHIEHDTVSEPDGTIGAGLSFLEAEVQRLNSEIAALSEDIRGRNEQLQGADNLRSRAFEGMVQYSGALLSGIDTYRSQRAWKVMVVLRKAYSLLTRRGLLRFVKWAVALPWAGVGELHEYELRFPDLWNFIPSEFRKPTQAVTGPKSLPSPTRKYDVIVLPIFDFEFRYQRPQQIAAQFAIRGHRVFWVSPSRTLPPFAGDYFTTVLLRDSLWEVQLRSEPFDIYAASPSSTHKKALLASLSELYRAFDVSESCVLVQFPFWRQAALGLRDTFGARVIYDCMDDWQHWTAEPSIGVSNLVEEAQLVRESDLLMVSSQEFLERFAALELKPLLIRNACDFDFFAFVAASWDGGGIPKPIVGYYGAIADWFDLELLEAVAQSRPNYQFVLIGQVHNVNLSSLKRLPNIHLLGEKHYRELPHFLAAFDVALIPFRLSNLTRGVDPVKLYEYFSQGKPVVATPLPELNRVTHLLSIARTPEDFTVKIDEALLDQDPLVRQKRIDFALENTWKARVADIDRAVQDRFRRVSILIVTYNSGEFLLPCLKSIAKNTSWPNYEVLIVDNHSTDGSDRIAEEFAVSDSRFHLYRQPTNLGFAGANNLAATYATGEYLVFLNADTIVTAGWLGRLIRHVTASPLIGAVVAVTNFSGNETKVNFDYLDQAGMEHFASKLASERHGEAIEISMAPLYCVLVPRSIWKEIGELDVLFEVGMFEDDDFSLRLRNAGFRIIAAEDCFVHHFGNGSFAKLVPEQINDRFERNRAYFEQKWNVKWQPHQLRPGVRPPQSDIRFTPEHFCRDVFAGEAARHPPMLLRCLQPEGTEVGQAFNIQPSGDAAIVAECDNATPGTVIVMDSMILATSYGNPRILSAIVPAAAYTHRGKLPVYLANDLGRSNTVEFEIR